VKIYSWLMTYFKNYVCLRLRSLMVCDLSGGGYFTQSYHINDANKLQSHIFGCVQVAVGSFSSSRTSMLGTSMSFAGDLISALI